jgi:hypothetical protein
MMVALGSIGRVLLPGVVFGVLTLAATAAGARVIVPVPPAPAVGTLLYAHGQGRSDALLRFEKKNPFCRWHPRHRLCAKLVALVRFCDRHPRHRLCEQADDDRFCKRNRDHRDCDDDRFCKKIRITGCASGLMTIASARCIESILFATTTASAANIRGIPNVTTHPAPVEAPSCRQAGLRPS